MSIMAFRAALKRRRFGRRFTKDNSGLSALEFALILPIMVVLYLGGFEVSEAFMINRKVTHATSVLGDLVAQSEDIDDAQMSNILDAVTAVMNPYPTQDMWMIVSGVQVDSDGIATIVWSDARNTTALSPGTAIVLPDAVTQPDTFLVVAEVNYAYTPTFGHSLTGVIDLQDIFFLRPRLQNSVDRI